MIKYFIVLFLLVKSLSACGLCTIYSPETKISIKLSSSEDSINKINVNWRLTEAFTNTLKNIYDKDIDGKLNSEEIKEVKTILLEYVEPRNYLVHLSYAKEINKKTSDKVDISSENVKLYIKDGILNINYTINNSFKLENNNILYLNIIDKEGYFALSFDTKNIEYDKKLLKNEILDENSITFIKNNNIIEEKLEVKKVETIKEEVKTEKSFLDEYTIKIKENLLKIENGDTIALFTLLLVSFIYGVIHALGPGHGKALAFSYFLSKKSSSLQAFTISQATAFIHIIGALILVLISIFIMESFFNNFVNNSIEIITKISAFFIMALAIYILYKKVKDKSCACHSCCSSHNPKEKNKKEDIFFVITAGIVPCPGTVVLFLYAFILETYFAVFLAAMFISLGMGMVIFLSSYLGINISKASNNIHTLKNTLEYLSPIFIFILGLLLFLNANILI